jgi:hypothetical protein
MKKFWEQKEWLDKTSTFQLIIDGVEHVLNNLYSNPISGGDSETKTKIEIINEDGSKNTFIR